MAHFFTIKNIPAGMMKYMVLLFMKKFMIWFFQIHSSFSPPHPDTRPYDCPFPDLHPWLYLPLDLHLIWPPWSLQVLPPWWHTFQPSFIAHVFLHPFPHLPYFYYIDFLWQCVIIVVFIGTIQFAFDYRWFFIVLSLRLPNQLANFSTI